MHIIKLYRTKEAWLGGRPTREMIEYSQAFAELLARGYTSSGFGGYCAEIHKVNSESFRVLTREDRHV
jgi:hypothetical protein